MYWSYQDTFIGSADILAMHAMVLSSLQWTMRTQVMLALSLGKNFAVYQSIPPLSLDKSFLSLNKLMLAEKGSPGCTGCQFQLILHALPMWHGINLF